MNLRRLPDTEAFFLPGTKGQLFALYYRPPSEISEYGSVLLAPPFAEEMNRCRAMVSMQARALARAGIATLVLDPYGTGDSGGEFEDGTWEQWTDDLRTGLRWLESIGQGCGTLWGIRLGALFALDVARTEPSIDRIVFWQPVVSGRSFLTQFLRIRIAAEFGEKEGVRGTEEFRRDFREDRPVEVAGYRIAPELGRDLDEKSLSLFLSRTEVRIDWFEILASESASVPQGQSKAIKECRDAGLRVDLHEICGPAFWQVHERTVAPNLIDATTAVLEENAG